MNMERWTPGRTSSAEGRPSGPQKAVVRSVIQSSWRRSLEGGIDASGSAAPIDQDRARIDHLLRKNADLIAAARPCFTTVSKMVEGTGAMIVLTDHEGVLVEALGDKATLRAGTDIHLTVGGMWDECSIGTNGIGTALAAGEPVFVHAAEHFCAGIKSWTCAGAPIRDPLDGEVVGVFDLSGYSAIFQPHNAIFVAAIAREIEQALAQRQREERTRLLEAFIANSPGYGSCDGLVIVDRLGRATYVNNMPTLSDGRREREPLVACGDKILEGPPTDLTGPRGAPSPTRSCVSPISVRFGWTARSAARLWSSRPVPRARGRSGARLFQRVSKRRPSASSASAPRCAPRSTSPAGSRAPNRRSRF